MRNSCTGKKNVCILRSMGRNAKRKLSGHPHGDSAPGFNRFGLEQANYSIILDADYCQWTRQNLEKIMIFIAKW